MNYDFDTSRANMVLEALHSLEEKYTAIIRSAAALGDEDTAADFGNDLTRLHILCEGFERKAVEAFGPDVAQLVDIPVGEAAVPGAEHQPLLGKPFQPSQQEFDILGFVKAVDLTPLERQLRDLFLKAVRTWASSHQERPPVSRKRA